MSKTYGRSIRITIEELSAGSKRPVLILDRKSRNFHEVVDNAIKCIIERKYAGSNEIVKLSGKYRPNGRTPFEDMENPFMGWLLGNSEQ